MVKVPSSLNTAVRNICMGVSEVYSVSSAPPISVSICDVMSTVHCHVPTSCLLSLLPQAVRLSASTSVSRSAVNFFMMSFLSSG